MKINFHTPALKHSSVKQISDVSEFGTTEFQAVIACSNSAAIFRQD
jgi:hypothetical protein